MRFREQNAVGHELDERVVGSFVREADLIADALSQRNAQLVGDALGDRARGDSSRLSAADHASRAEPQFEAYLRNLRRFAASRLSADDDDLRIADELLYLLATFDDRQFRVIRDFRKGLATFFDLFDRDVAIFHELLKTRLPVVERDGTAVAPRLLRSFCRRVAVARFFRLVFLFGVLTNKPIEFALQLL